MKILLGLCFSNDFLVLISVTFSLFQLIPYLFDLVFVLIPCFLDLGLKS